MAIEKIPPEVETKLRKLRELQAVLEKLLRDKGVFEAALNEVNKLLEELEKYENDVELYKLLGTVFVRTTKEKLVEELKQRKESLELKLKKLEAMIKQTEKEVRDLEEEIRRLVAGGGGKPPAGS